MTTENDDNTDFNEEEEKVKKQDSSTTTTATSTLFCGNNDDKQLQVSKMREYIQRIRSILLNQGGIGRGGGSDDDGGDGSNTSDVLCYQLNSQILPTHRIICTTTPKGRIAFVRQLGSNYGNNNTTNNNKAELIIDYDASVKNELERFGFRVLNYPKRATTTKTNTTTTTESTAATIITATSALGKFLIP